MSGRMILGAVPPDAGLDAAAVTPTPLRREKQQRNALGKMSEAGEKNTPIPAGGHCQIRQVCSGCRFELYCPQARNRPEAVHVATLPEP